MGRGGSRPGASRRGPGITDGKRRKVGNELDYEQINTKMSLIQNIIICISSDTRIWRMWRITSTRGCLPVWTTHIPEYYTAEDYRRCRRKYRGVYSGIGAMLSQNRNTGLCTIVRV